MHLITRKHIGGVCALWCAVVSTPVKSVDDIEAAHIANHRPEFIANINTRASHGKMKFYSMANFFDQQEKAVIKIILVNQPEALFITLAQVEDKWAVVDGSADELTNRVVELMQ